MTQMELIRRVVSAHLDRDRYDHGFADLWGLLQGPYDSFTHGIAILRRLDDDILDEIDAGPTRRYFEHYETVNRELNEVAARIAQDLDAHGVTCEVVPSTVRDELLDEQLRKSLMYPVSHKQVATRAGLGWIGKTDLLVSRRFGPRVRLASIVTSVPLETGEPVTRSECGSCTLCVDECPAQAARDHLWQAGDRREDFFDAFACRDYCRKVSQERLGISISLCGKCVCLCPLGRA